MTKYDVFAALADENRRKLLQILSDEGPKTATQLTEQLPITRQGITKHLQSLKDAGLLAVQQRGRDKLYHLTPEPLNDAVAWIADVSAKWDTRLDSLKSFLEDGDEQR